MYRHVQCPTLIARCTESGAPPVLDQELDTLVRTNPNVEVVRLPLTHLAPAWDAIDDVASVALDFLTRPLQSCAPNPQR
jgi:pimeloyl-ACP methyl ester carboxylesterase